MDLNNVMLSPSCQEVDPKILTSLLGGGRCTGERDLSYRLKVLIPNYLRDFAPVWRSTIWYDFFLLKEDRIRRFMIF